MPLFRAGFGTYKPINIPPVVTCTVRVRGSFDERGRRSMAQLRRMATAAAWRSLLLQVMTDVVQASVVERFNAALGMGYMSDMKKASHAAKARREGWGQDKERVLKQIKGMSEARDRYNPKSSSYGFLSSMVDGLVETYSALDKGMDLKKPEQESKHGALSTGEFTRRMGEILRTLSAPTSVQFAVQGNTIAEAGYANLAELNRVDTPSFTKYGSARPREPDSNKTLMWLQLELGTGAMAYLKRMSGKYKIPGKGWWRYGAPGHKLMSGLILEGSHGGHFLWVRGTAEAASGMSEIHSGNRLMFELQNRVLGAIYGTRTVF